MTPLGTRRTRKQRREATPAPRPYLPHSSWSLSPSGKVRAGAAALKPSDFWEKLGL